MRQAVCSSLLRFTLREWAFSAGLVANKLPSTFFAQIVVRSVQFSARANAYKILKTGGYQQINDGYQQAVLLIPKKPLGYQQFALIFVDN
jgi:hypothetical protein